MNVTREDVHAWMRANPGRGYKGAARALGITREEAETLGRGAPKPRAPARAREPEPAPTPPPLGVADMPRAAFLRLQINTLAEQLDQMAAAESWQAVVAGRRQLSQLRDELDREEHRVSEAAAKREADDADALAGALLDRDRPAVDVRRALLREKIVLYRRAVSASSYTAADKLSREISALVSAARADEGEEADLFDEDLIVADILSAPREAMVRAVLESPWLADDDRVRGMMRGGPHERP